MRERAAHNERSEVEAELEQEQASASAYSQPRPSTSEPSRREPSTQQQQQQRSGSGGAPFAASHHFKPEEVITRLTERITGAPYLPTPPLTQDTCIE
jgi:hypothetical protein